MVTDKRRLLNQHRFFGGPLDGLRDFAARDRMFWARACVEALLCANGNPYTVRRSARKDARHTAGVSLYDTDGRYSFAASGK